MLDHTSIAVSNYARSKAFYETALAPLGFKVVMEYEDYGCGIGTPGKPFFWLAKTGSPRGVLHVAFTAPDRATVDRFYEAAIAAGGRDNGKPAVRPDYYPDCYAAFVFDPDGVNVEAVFHCAE